MTRHRTRQQCRWYDEAFGNCHRPPQAATRDNSSRFLISHWLVRCRGVKRNCGFEEKSACGNCRFSKLYPDGERFCDNVCSASYRHEVLDAGICGGWEGAFTP